MGGDFCAFAVKILVDRKGYFNMPKKGENIYKRKDGRWEGRYIRGRKNNRAVYGYVYGQTYHEVKENSDLPRKI